MAGTAKKAKKYYEPPMSPHTAELDPNTGLPRRTSTSGGYNKTQVVKPAVPGVPSPQIQPFRRPEDDMQKIDREAAMREAFFQMDRELADARANTNYESGQIDKQATYGKRDTNDNMAGRGLGQSSIKDAEIFDIEATARTRKEFLGSQLSQLEASYGQRKLDLGNDFGRFMEAMNKQMVSNATEASAGMPQYTQKPQAAVTANYKPVVKDGWFWRYYDDGRKEKVRQASGA